ncbi:MAG: Flp pilus assembly protein CpaB [Chloroflexi bacterium]|nr:Flp pilus assembly protein CpaB [Chloroflexota bacterium]
MGAIRRRKALILALMLGLVAALVSYQYVQQKAALPPPPVEMTRVVVAAADIPSRTKLSKTMLKLEEMPLSAKHPDALTSLTEAEGKVTRLPITAGEQVLSKKFSLERAESGLAFMLAPSKRAVAIKVNEVTGTGGLILPGDHVDVIAVFDAKTFGKDSALFVLQDIEVLAVAQTIEGVADTSTIIERGSGMVGLTPSRPATSRPKPQPEAKSITVAVDPEQAQRLVLAEERGKLRIVLRPYKDTRQVELGQATLGNIQAPLKQGQARITSVSISPTELRIGDTMKVEITVKNTSTVDIRSQGPGPGFTYIQGQTFYSQAYPSQAGAYRVGLNFAGQAPVEFPYRWGFGGSLPAGSSVTVVGHVRFLNEFKLTNFWAGLVLEPAEIVEDSVGMTPVVVMAANGSVVIVDNAQVRSAPSIGSSVVESLPFGTELTVLSKEADWYRIAIPGTDRQGYVAAAWISGPR